MSRFLASPGSQTMTEFCEQVNPRVLLEMRQSRPFPEMRRVQESWVAAHEKRALLWLAARTPQWIGPDHLTALGLAAQLGAGACYVLAAWNRYALLGVIVCLALNWLGDSLDGTLARARQQLRPRYGFYVDHMVDSFGALALMGGLALSGYMHPWIAIGLLDCVPHALDSVLSGDARAGRVSSVVLALWSNRTAHPARRWAIWRCCGSRKCIFSADITGCSTWVERLAWPEWR